MNYFPVFLHSYFLYSSLDHISKPDAASCCTRLVCSYHFHHNNEETFYIISGEGILRTPNGERKVSAGELLFFPTGADGAHKLTNSSETENLVYIDFDVVHDVDITIYPDSDKIGVWGMGINKLYPQASDVDYYDGE